MDDKKSFLGGWLYSTRRLNTFIANVGWRTDRLIHNGSIAFLYVRENPVLNNTVHKRKSV